ncbi:(2Fe-2S) ferredoxin domain-containing protein [Paenibacillus spongiae]|uniref:(2Fe-2S) ferredoxin domain-containing protein n=1 Tax=Paenibacillus spongiae TaxID=2909671 RepID=A0ABY5S3A6_9BACL|nr:(2Fe-2S) ferredoxin domain-containing protein [Paenibacillus spongiae]UVI27342.1 (2Fe-2S) ferredoxin domain-containing protein [Paenibacillus spongiae]
MAKKSKSEERMERMKHHILVCRGPSCSQASSEDVLIAMRKHIKNENLDETVRITVTDCMLRCSQSPTVVVYPDGVWYQKMTIESAEKIIKEHLLREEIVVEKAQYRLVDGKFVLCKVRKGISK